MNRKRPPISKITRPRISKLYLRKRLFRSLDAACKKPVVWGSGLAGSGKTSLVAQYLDHHRTPSIWYQMDEGDSDLATFFYDRIKKFPLLLARLWMRKSWIYISTSTMCLVRTRLQNVSSMHPVLPFKSNVKRRLQPWLIMPFLR